VAENYFDPSVRRLASSVELVIRENQSFDSLEIQGFSDDLKDVFRRALLIVHEFLCTATNRFAVLRETFHASATIAVTACVELLKAEFPLAGEHKGLILLAFKAAYDRGIEKFCIYVGENVSLK